MLIKDVKKTLKASHPKGYVTSGQYQSNSYSAPYYVVATEQEGLYFYVNQRDQLEMTLHLPWADVPEMLYLRKDKKDKTYRTKEELLLTIFVGDAEGKMVAELIERRRKLLPWAKFPWYRKIPGYRSQVAWKMVLASMFYFFFLGMFFATALEGEDETKKVVKQPIVQTEAEEEPAKKKTESDAEKKKKAEELAAAKKAKAAEDKKKAEQEKKKKLALEKKKAEEKREAQRKAKIVAEEKAKKEATAKLAAQQEAERKAQEEAAQRAEEEAAVALPISFDNCDDLRTEYPNGVPSTHPAYEAKMDRDKDNFACERN